MWDFSIAQAPGLMVRTVPFVIFRVVVYFRVTVAFILATGTGAGVGWGLGALGDDGFQANATFYGGVLGFGLTTGVIGAVTGLVQGLLSILPIPGPGNIMAALRAYLKLAVGLVDEVILAHGGPHQGR